MKITVCIKQVPGTSQVEIDEKTGVLKRDGVESKMNPYDLYALETAMRIKQDQNAEVGVITMGPPQAETVIREAFMMGVDKGSVLSDRKFAGSDVLATSYTLAQGIRKAGLPDIIICGKQTTDGDTAQVGAELAEFLNIPHVTNVCRIRSVTAEKVTLDIDMPLHVETVEVKLPCLISVEKGIFEPRLPSFKLKTATADRKIEWIKLDDLENKDEMHYGLNGSPTQVKRIFPPESHNERVSWRGSSGEVSEKLFSFLKDKKFLQQSR